MKSYNISEARDNLAAIVKLAEEGEVVELLRRGVPVVRVVPVRQTVEQVLATFRARRAGKQLGMPPASAIAEGRRS